MSLVHPTAVVHPRAIIGEGTKIGAFSIVGEHVRLGARCEIQEHVVLRGHTAIGDDTRIFPFSVIGAEPQHLKYKGEPTTVQIGNRVILRESVTVNSGTEFGNKTTIIGDDSYLMAYCHVAHDCVVGKGVIFANGVNLGGHVVVEDYVTVGGMSAITQNCRAGRYAYIGGVSILRKDMAPFTIGKGNDFEISGINSIGLKRKGFSDETITSLKKIYKIFFLQNLTAEHAIDKILSEVGETDEVKTFVDFYKGSKMGLIR